MLKNHTSNVAEQLFPDSFLKNQNWVYLWINNLKFYTICFYCMLIWGVLKCSAFILYICFFLKKRGLELVSLPYFLHGLWWKIFLLLYSINWSNFIVWLPLICEMFSSMCFAIVCCPGCDVINFKINLVFLIELFFYMTKKSRQNLRYLENEKSL